MKRVLASVAVLLAVATLRPAPGTAQASVGHFVEHSAPFAFSEFVPCANNGAGEQVEGSAEQNVVAHFVQSASQNLRMQLQLNSHGTGVGQVTGDKYVFNQQLRDHVFVGNPLPFSAVFGFKSKVVGQGAGNNLSFFMNVHIVFNANGELTSNFSDFRFECK
jgi:hypothetical protein